MKAYFQVAIQQHIERASQLLEATNDSDLPRDFYALATTCRTQIKNAIKQLEDLLYAEDFQLSETQTIRLRSFRRVVDRINQFEVTGIAVLSRPRKDDTFLTRLVDLICKEIKYPYTPPTVATLSTSHFSIHNDIGLMLVPFNEGNYLLHLPDLYHELAHLLLFDKQNPKVDSFQQAADSSLAQALEYINAEIEYEEQRQGPKQFQIYLTLWQYSWSKNWIIEFYCDLFAVFTLGPAFVWSHIHLCMKLDHNPFSVPTYTASSHPADDARMRVMLMGLAKVGFNDVIDELQSSWNQYLAITDMKSDGNYRRCFPEHLLSEIVDLAYKGITQTPCRIVNPNITDAVHQTLNQAWHQFWHEPYSYIQWEKQTINELRTMCGIGKKEGTL